MRPMIAKMRLKMAMIGPGTSYQPGPAECAERLNKLKKNVAGIKQH